MELKDLKITEIKEDIKQYTKHAEIPIFFACDEKFVKYTMVSIKSIMENASRNRKYHIYILHMGIGIPAQSRVTAMADPEFEIDFVDARAVLDVVGHARRSGDIVHFPVRMSLQFNV